MEAEDSAITQSRLVLNVGGTDLHIEASLVGLASLDTRAGRYLAPRALGEIMPRFVDERIKHMDLLVDCLRHGMDGFDFMGDYDASIVNALFSPLSPRGGSLSERDNSVGVFRDVENSMPAVVVRLRVGREAFDVLASTLSPSDYDMVPRDSPLRHVGSAGGQWKSKRAHDERFVVDQNALHFALLLDCLRYGVEHLQHVESTYDLWGLSALASYYAITRVRDAAQLAIGYREYLAVPLEQRCVTYILGPTIIAYNMGLVQCKSNTHDTPLPIRHPVDWPNKRVLGLVAAALGIEPSALAVYLPPGQSKCNGWYRLCDSDCSPYGSRHKGECGELRRNLFAESITGCRVPHELAPLGAIARNCGVVILNAVVFDVSAKPHCMRELGPVIIRDVENGRPATQVLQEACRQRDSCADRWIHVAIVTNTRYYKPSTFCCTRPYDAEMWAYWTGFVLVHGNADIDPAKAVKHYKH